MRSRTEPQPRIDPSSISVGERLIKQGETIHRVQSRFKLRQELNRVNVSLFDEKNLTAAEQALDRVASILGLPWPWWTPDISAPLRCRRSERFSLDRGWTTEMMASALRLPVHVRCRFEHMPFVTRIDYGHSDASPEALLATRVALRMGISAILRVPVHTADGRIALFSWAGRKPSSRLDDLVPEIAGELLAIGNHFMRIYATEHAPSIWTEIERPALTRREWDCLRTLGQGYRDSEVVDLLGISKSTLRFHVSNVVRRFGCKTRTQAIAMSAQLGLLGPIGN